MRKLSAAAIFFCTAIALSGCNGGGTSFFSLNAKASPSPTPTAAPIVISKENSITTKITGENEMNPIVIIEMENGMTINLELYPDKAPNTVNNFISLAGKGFYDGLTLHRIIDGFMIQGGCPDGTGMGGPGYQIPGEFSSNGYNQNDINHVSGVISMARSRAKDSAGSQFFIMVGKATHLDGDYAAFGKTVDDQSLQNCLELAKVKVSGDSPINPPVIKSIKIDTKGVDYKEPNHS